jgi:hypothetical protein
MLCRKNFISALMSYKSKAWGEFTSVHRAQKTVFNLSQNCDCWCKSKYYLMVFSTPSIILYMLNDLGKFISV